VEVANRHVVVTGAAGGIGRALVRRFDAEGARAVVAADRDLDGARSIAGEVGGLAVQLDAGSEDSVRRLIAETTEAYGPIDVFLSNAGVPGAMGGPEAPWAAAS
jgi:NAD(P)-dependent dehydrogenase (short-subunit alcohol dehydrogenase family)